MLTPAEELGLAGMNVGSRVRGAFHKIDEIALAAMIEQIRLESLKNHVVYLRDGQPDAINVMACPLTVLPDQVAYIHYVTLTIHNALKRLVELYTPLIRGWLRRHTLLPQDADDVVQEVLTVVVRKLPQFRRQPFVDRCVS